MSRARPKSVSPEASISPRAASCTLLGSTPCRFRSRPCIPVSGKVRFTSATGHLPSVRGWLVSRLHHIWKDTRKSVNFGVDVLDYKPVQLEDIQRRAKTLPVNVHLPDVEPGMHLESR